MAATATTLKPHSHFSIDSILRKENGSPTEQSSLSTKLSTSSYASDISHHDEDQGIPFPDSFRRNLMRENISPRDYKSVSTGNHSNDSHRGSDSIRGNAALHDDLPVLENKHSLIEHWVYKNHYQQQDSRRKLLPLNSYRELNSYNTKRNSSFSSSSSSEFEMVPSPLPKSSWTSSRNEPISSKRHTLDYLFLDRMMRNYNNGSSYPNSLARRTSTSDPSLYSSRYYWNLGLHEERDGYPPLLTRSPRIKSSLSLRDDDSDEGNRKGGQVRFTHTQSTELERVFSLQKYVSPQERKQLARSIDLSERQVKTWFQNRRAKWRRVKLEDEMRARMVEVNITSNKLDKVEDMKTDADFRLDCRVHEDTRVC